MVTSQTELLVQHGRRQLWVALVLVVAFGIGGLFVLAFPGTGGVDTAFMVLYPDLIAISLLSLRRSKRMLAGFSAAKMQAAVDDELRKHSLNLAWRNAFFVVLFVQPLLAFALISFRTANQVAVMAGTTALAGVATALASVLYYDR